jgi:hypothetical protein
MTNAEMISRLKRQLHVRAELLLSEEQYALAAEAASVLEALEKAERLLSDMPAPSDSPQGIAPSVSLSAEPPLSPEAEPEYPAFLRTDDDLVKIGWSSKKEEEYVHRAPKASVVAVCEAVKHAADGHRAFGRDDLKGVVTPEGDSVPDYQVYMCLSWLRWAGLVNRVQRGKYAVPSHAEFARLWVRAWGQLPQEHL